LNTTDLRQNGCSRRSQIPGSLLDMRILNHTRKVVGIHFILATLGRESWGRIWVEYPVP
jgi:hypothetical protein